VRILMLAQFYAPTIGGEERHVQDLSVELVRRGHDVAVVTLDQKGLVDFEVDQGVRIHRIRSTTQRAGWLYSEAVRTHAPPIPDPEALLALRRVIALEQPQIVHAHNWLVHSFLPLRFWSNIGLVVTLHDYSFSCAKKRLMYREEPCNGPGFAKCLTCAANHYGVAKGISTTLANWAMGYVERNAVDMFVPVSYATAVGNGLLGSGLPYRIIPNFVPDDIATVRDEADPRLEQLPDGDYLLFVGDLSKDKGIEVLLRAYAGMTDAPPLVLIGRDLQDGAHELSPNVMHLGSWPHNVVMEAWRRSTIALIPSIWPEPFGLVAIEAMAAGRPTVASRIGGLEDIVVDGETGLLVQPADPSALRQAIKRLIANPELREAMGQAGRRRVAEFHISKVVPQIEQVYRTVFSRVRAAKKVRQRNDEEQDYFGVRDS